MNSRVLYISFGIFMAMVSMVNPSKSGDVIFWTPEMKLEWKDFKGRPDESLRFDALSHCGLEMDMSQNSPDEIHFKVRATFEPKESWVKGGESTDYLLAHEQLHFDIYERYARELRKELQAHQYGDPGQTSEDVSTLYDKMNQLIYDAQTSYDEDTRHSHDVVKQREWEELIALELEEFEEYAATEFTVAIEQ